MSKPDDPTGWVQGTFVITGYMGNKKHEHVFVPVPGVETLSGENITSIIQNLEDDDQISDWQKHAFTVDKPDRSSRRKPGAVRDGEPIFYILKPDGEIDFLGVLTSSGCHTENRPMRCCLSLIVIRTRLT